MRAILVVLPALLVAGCAAAQRDGRADPRDAATNIPPTEYRSAFDGYRRYAEQDLRDWRGANDEVRDAGGHAGHRPGQGPGTQTSKPQPGTPQPSGGHRQ